MGYDAKFSDPLYKHTPFYMSFDRRKNTCYGLLYDNASEGILDFGKEHAPAFQDYYRTYQCETGPLDFFFMAGPSMAKVTQQLSIVTGRQALGPAYLSGYMGSSMSIIEGEGAQENLKQFALDCEKFDVRISMFHLSSGYTLLQSNNNRSVFYWNLDRFPDPKAMFNDNFGMHNQGVGPNVKPHLLETNPLHNGAREKGAFLFRETKDSNPKNSNPKDENSSIRVPAIAGYWANAAFNSLPNKSRLEINSTYVNFAICYKLIQIKPIV